MTIEPTYLVLAISLIFTGGILSAGVVWRLRFGNFRQLADELIDHAQQDADALLQRAKLDQEQWLLESRQEFASQCERKETRIRKEEERIQQQAAALEKRIDELDRSNKGLLQAQQALHEKAGQLQDREQKLEKAEQTLALKTERLGNLTHDEARESILNTAREQVASEAQQLRLHMLQEIEQDASKEARQIIATAINRMAVSTVSEVTVSTVALPNDEMKGRIIGREGRNIRAFERETGVNILIDDTPGAVVLSSFDPLRKQIAKMALADLVLDGRIHPSRIQAVVASKREEIQERIVQYGEDAAARLGIVGMHTELLKLCGQLKFRYSFGQNVLDHSIEVAQIMNLIAHELGLNAQLAKRIGLLHDIGKAAPQNQGQSHALTGYKLAKAWGETEEVANGIGCHHGEQSPLTIEASLCGAADAISASRPGARNEAVEAYVSRLQQLEQLTEEFPGVEKAFSLQAGREIYISILPDMVDDDGLQNLARDIRSKIEQAVSYQGKIKVQVVREKRVTEYAQCAINSI